MFKPKLYVDIRRVISPHNFYYEHLLCKWTAVYFSAYKCFLSAAFSSLLRSGCWRGTNWRRLHASPKAPTWSPETKTSMFLNQYASFLAGPFAVIMQQGNFNRTHIQLIQPFAVVQVSNRGEAHLELNAFRRKHDCALVISGDSLEVCPSRSCDFTPDVCEA